MVSACPTCTVALKHEFAQRPPEPGKTEWLREGRGARGEGRSTSPPWSRSSWTSGSLKIDAKKLGTITYHDSCHLKRTLHVSEEPRALLRKAGHEVVEMYESRHVLRHGRLLLPEVPGDQQADPAEEAEEHPGHEAGNVAMDCPGCVMQIRGGFDKEGGPGRGAAHREAAGEGLEEEPPADRKPEWYRHGSDPWRPPGSSRGPLLARVSSSPGLPRAPPPPPCPRASTAGGAEPQARRRALRP